MKKKIKLRRVGKNEPASSIARMPLAIVPTKYLTSDEVAELQALDVTDALCEQFQKALETKDDSYLTPYALWADMTFVVSFSYVKKIKAHCTGRFTKNWTRLPDNDPAGVEVYPIIEEHPILGWVFHTLVFGDKVFKKEQIAKRFDKTAKN